MNTERAVQPKFRIATLAAALLLLAAIALFDRWLASIPNRHELGWRSARLEFTPVRLAAPSGPLRLVGAWRVTSGDPRFGGVSALAIDRGRLLALSDSGVVIRFAPPGRGAGAAEIGELPGGPAGRHFKRNRDSEAMVRDSAGRGWWVAFENRDQLWLYDPTLRRPLKRTELGDRGWRENRGVEGMTAQGEALLLFPELGDRLLRVTGTTARFVRIANSRGRIADAAALGDGAILAVERRPTPLGFRNALVRLEPAAPGYRLAARTELPLGPLDNLEAIAIEPLPGGSRRLWLMTDDNLQPPLRTLLVVLEMPAEGAAAGTRR